MISSYYLFIGANVEIEIDICRKLSVLSTDRHKYIADVGSAVNSLKTSNLKN